MDINSLLLWVAAIAIVTDFCINLFSHKNRKFGGYMIGAMAYVILLADLTYSLYAGKGDTMEFKRVLTGTLVVGALFIVEYAINNYRFIRIQEKGFSDRLDMDSLEEEVRQLKVKLQRETDRCDQMKSSIDNIVQKKKEELHFRNLRVISNEEYEDKLLDEKAVGDTREAFQLYSLLIRGYEMERGPKHERRLHNICEKICAHLDKDEVQALLQIDCINRDNAGAFYDAT